MTKLKSKIYILCPVHRRPDLVQQQLLSYNAGCPGAIFILHPSIEGRSNKIFDKIKCYKALKNLKIIFTSQSVGTSYKSTMGAFIECTKLIKSDKNAFVFIHTDGALF